MMDIAHNISIIRTSRACVEYFYFCPRLLSTLGDRYATVSNAKYYKGLEKHTGDTEQFYVQTQLTGRL